MLIIHFHTCSSFTKALEKIRLEGHDDHDIDIFVEKRITHLHSQIDLTTTLDGLQLLEKYTYRLDHEYPHPLGKVLANNLDKRLDRIAKKITRVTGHDHLKGKQKRSIELIGNLISDLFGNPGPADWKQINSNILALKNAITKVNSNLDIDHADIDTNRHAIEHQNVELRSLNKILNKNRAELTKVDDELSSIRMFFELMTLADVVESNVDFLIEIKVDSMKGFCSDRALSKDFLVDHLLNIEANKVGLGPIFSSWEWSNYYKNKMCTVALEKSVLWVTIRIPIVKKSEKLIRAIPTPVIKEVMLKAADYGLDLTLFKEKDNEKFHMITKTSLDLCNQLGNTRTCGVRDMKFSIGSEVVVPVEFALNRVLVVGLSAAKIKVMSKCPSGISELTIDVDSVWRVPNNCSYTSSFLSIEARESDVEVTSEIGIIHVDRFEFKPVHNLRLNRTALIIDEVINSTKSGTFYRNRIEVQDKLATIETNHVNLSNTYALEKWFVVGGICLLLTLYAAAKLFKSVKNKRSEIRDKKDAHENIELTIRVPPQQQPFQQQQPVHSGQIDLNTDSNEQPPDQRHGQQQPGQQQPEQHQQQQQRQQQQQLTHDRSEQKGAKSHVYAEIADSSSISFSSRPEHSQFYNK